MLLQVLFAILLAALGIAQAQMSFPDITQAAAAIERVFGTIDRTPSIDARDSAGTFTVILSYLMNGVSMRRSCRKWLSQATTDITSDRSFTGPAGGGRYK